MTSIIQQSTKEKKHRKALESSEMCRRYHRLLKIQAGRLGIIPLDTLPKIKFKNYCIVSGKARSVYAKSFKLTRHQIKAYFNYISGLKASSW